MNETELLNAKVSNLFKILDELICILKRHPELEKELVINTTINDFYLISRGAK